MTSVNLDPASFEQLDYYKRVGVDRSIEQSLLNKAYHKRSLKYHPDRNPPESKSEATRCFQLLQDAHTVLKNPVERAQYDAWLTTASAGSAYDKNSDGGFGNLWAPGNDFRSHCINFITAASILVLFVMMLSKLTLKSAYSRVLKITNHVLLMVFNQQEAITSVSKWLESYRLDFTMVVLAAIVVGDLLDVGGSNDEYSRPILGCCFMWACVASFRGVHDPQEDDEAFFWWDSAFTTGFFSFWYWHTGTALIPSALWAFVTVYTVSSALQYLYGDNVRDMVQTLEFIRVNPIQSTAIAMVPLTLWLMQYSIYLRGIMFIYFFRDMILHRSLCVADPLFARTGHKTGTAATNDDGMAGWHLVQVQAVIIYLYPWANYGIIWTIVLTMVWWLLQNRLVPSTLNATYVVLLILTTLGCWDYMG